jgi:hypothetical protein
VLQLAAPLFLPVWLFGLWTLAVGLTLAVRRTRAGLSEPRPETVLA